MTKTKTTKKTITKKATRPTVAPRGKYSQMIDSVLKGESHVLEFKGDREAAKAAAYCLWNARRVKGVQGEVAVSLDSEKAIVTIGPRTASKTPKAAPKKRTRTAKASAAKRSKVASIDKEPVNREWLHGRRRKASKAA